ncbi:hypothetical protein LTR62_002518 [Meristemomyces frigidus]|uniref:F-box domain-containing protein n=1 Tax=Meristemomyces frigidus TaxID=1508187 RepID=A0AAN7TLP2_9PEZI|nr:hypothetical protein LTR62_002518 [Meristemomyces frigidus]
MEGGVMALKTESAAGQSSKVEHVHQPADVPVLATTSTGSVSADEEYTIVQTAALKLSRRVVVDLDDEPLIDTTVALAKNSKKTRRLEKQQQKRQLKAAARARPQSPFDLPAELLHQILSYLTPSEVFRVELLSHATHAHILQNERSIARKIIETRYSILSRCFPLPMCLSGVDDASRSALLHPRRVQMTEIHKKPYQHIRPIDTTILCSCPSCLMAWNNLNLILDFASFQPHLDHREPIPIIPRGTTPQWNSDLLETHAHIVERAMESPLTYAAILETHLQTTVGTLLRKTRFPAHHIPVHRHNNNSNNKAPLAAKTVHPLRLYHVTERDANGTDAFLSRDGKPSYEFPFQRDNYYSLLAYVPNRKWDKEVLKWVYYSAGGHERDLEMLRRWFPVRVGG